MHIYINTSGTYIHVRNNMFEIRKPKDDGTVKKYLIAPHKITGLILSKGVLITTNALALAVENNIDVVLLSYYGRVLGRFWHSRLGSTTLIRRKQTELRNSAMGVEIIKNWIARKLQNQIDFLQRLARYRKRHKQLLTETIKKITDIKQKISDLQADTIDQVEQTLRGLEGTAGRLYFSTLSQLLAKRYQFDGRSYRPAKDMFNAFLNYGYGILYARVEKALIIAGIEPYMGILHRDDYNHKSMVYDFIEPYRIWIEEVVFKLFSAKKVNQDHIREVPDGKLLNNQGKQLLIAALTKYLDQDRIRYKNRLFTRDAILQAEAYEFAQKLLKS